MQTVPWGPDPPCTERILEREVVKSSTGWRDFPEWHVIEEKRTVLSYIFCHVVRYLFSRLTGIELRTAPKRKDEQKRINAKVG
jgi:hypothetical protein